MTAAEVVERPRTEEAPRPTDQDVTDAPRLGYAIARSLLPARVSDRVLRSLPIIAILVLQTLLFARLASTAWGDEGLYIQAGHNLLGHWLHGRSVSGQHYDRYFSGAPWGYPVIAALLDDVGGVGLVRWFSGLCMLGATVCVYRIGVRWFGEAPGRLGALVFATLPSVAFLGFFATYDAMCLSLLALALWLGTCRRSLLAASLAGIAEALAITVKYAGALWVPFIIVITATMLWREVGTRSIARLATTLATLAASLGVVFATFGHALLPGVELTTTQRRVLLPTGVPTLVGDVTLDIGVGFAIGAVGLVLWARGRGRSAWLLAAAVSLGALAAPLHQMQIHERVAIHKHDVFGMIFLAPFAGYALYLLARRPIGRVATVLLLALVITLSAQRATWLYTRNNISPQIIATVQRFVATHDVVGGEGVGSTDPNSFSYYTRRGSPAVQWLYASVAAVKHGSYRAIVLRNLRTSSHQQSSPLALLAAAEHNPYYRLVLSTPLRPGYRTLKWFVFVHT